MGIISKVLKGNAILFGGGTCLTLYTYPELRKEPDQLVKAMYRGYRCVKTGTMMIHDYLYVMSQHPDFQYSAKK